MQKTLILLSSIFLFLSCTSSIYVYRNGSLREKTEIINTNDEFVWGINGHPVSDVDYVESSLDQQLNLIKEHQLDFYRFDVRINEAGEVIWNPERFQELLIKSRQMEIELLPVILINQFLGDYKISESEAFRRGKVQMEGFTKKYGSYINYYALGNEQDIRIINEKTDGKFTSDYDYEKFKIVAAYLQGMEEGIKSIKPEAKTIVNSAGWLHYGYYQLLKENNVNYDILGYHWYSFTDSYSRDFGEGNNMNIIRNRFSKPIWLTEINRADGSRGDYYNNQARLMERFIEDLNNHPQIKGFFIYELYDQPALSQSENSKYPQSEFGIIKWTSNPPNYNQFEYKPVSDVIKFSVEEAKHGYEDYVYQLILTLTGSEPEKNELQKWTTELERYKNREIFLRNYFAENQIQLFQNRIISGTKKQVIEIKTVMDSAYLKYLQRSPNIEESKFWTKKLQKKNQRIGIDETLLLSEEFWQNAIWSGYERRTGYERPK